MHLSDNQVLMSPDLHPYLSRYLNTDKLYYSIGAYNDMLPTKLAGQTCHLVGSVAEEDLL